MIVQQIASSGNDEFYTPEYAIKPIMKYLPPPLRQSGAHLTQKKVCM